jgi:hypothetical protein
MKYLRLLNMELFFWLGALIYLSAIDPAGTSHLALCPIKNIGLDICPGCGLGQSVSFLLHGYLKESVQCHPLGIPALGVIAGRVTQLVKLSILKYRLNINGG